MDTISAISGWDTQPQRGRTSRGRNRGFRTRDAVEWGVSGLWSGASGVATPPLAAAPWLCTIPTEDAGHMPSALWPVVCAGAALAVAGSEGAPAAATDGAR